MVLLAFWKHCSGQLKIFQHAKLGTLKVLFFEAQHYWSELFIVPPEFRLHPPSIHHPSTIHRCLSRGGEEECCEARPRFWGRDRDRRRALFWIGMVHRIRILHQFLVSQCIIYHQISSICWRLPNDSHHLPSGKLTIAMENHHFWWEN